MIPVLSVETMQAVDAAAADPIDVLMDRAGYAVALAAADMGAGYGSRVRVLAGRGNNGGDGYVAARYLARRGVAVTIHRSGAPEPDSATGRAAERARSARIPIVDLGAPVDADLIIDAAFGTGFRGTLPDDLAPWVSTRAPVLAVDIPSGLRGDDGGVDGPAFTAHRTVTFHAPKPGHVLGEGPDRCGRLDIVDIGLHGGAPAMHLAEAADLHLPPRSRTTHKWRAGAVATVGGVPGLTGAALMAARTALRAGAGVSTILATARTADLYQSLAPDLVVLQGSETGSWRDHASEVLSLLGRYDVLVLGPGLEPAPTQFVERLLEGFDGPMVVDAGAVTAIRRLDTLLERRAPTVLTPHAGEFRRLTGVEASHTEAMRLAAATGSVILLKGNPTFVAGRDLIVARTGGPELASIGTGDVLAGTVGAFLARGMDTEEAAWAGAVVHGLAGASLASRTTLTAPGLMYEIGAIVARLESGDAVS